MDREGHLIYANVDWISLMKGKLSEIKSTCKHLKNYNVVLAGAGAIALTSTAGGIGYYGMMLKIYGLKEVETIVNTPGEFFDE